MRPTLPTALDGTRAVIRADTSKARKNYSADTNGAAGIPTRDHSGSTYRQTLVKNPRDALRGPFDCEARDYAFPPGLPHLPARFGVRQKRANRPRHRVGVSHRNQQSGAAIND